jgi:hypothetical protein
MKKIHKLMLMALLLAGLSPALAQDNDSTKKEPEMTKRDTTEISWRKKTFVIISDDDGTRFKVNDNNDYDRNKKKKRELSNVGFMALDFGVNNYFMDGNFGKDALEDPRLEVKPFRPLSHVGLHFLPTTASLIGRGAVNLQTAISIDYNNYYFVNDITLVPKQDMLTVADSTGSFEVNKLFARYAQIPLMLNFNTRPGSDDGVSLSVGGYAGVLWKARTKQKTDGGGKNHTTDDFNLNTFRYGLTARMTFKWFRFYANYNLSSLFDVDEGPNTQTFSAGFIVFDFQNL